MPQTIPISAHVNPAYGRPGSSSSIEEGADSGVSSPWGRFPEPSAWREEAEAVGTGQSASCENKKSEYGEEATGTVPTLLSVERTRSSRRFDRYPPPMGPTPPPPD